MSHASVPAFDDDRQSMNHQLLVSEANSVRSEEQVATKIFVQEPQPYDVMCGRDRNYSKHPGNQVYQKLIEENVAEYQISDKQGMQRIVRSILSTMGHRYGSRFLRASSAAKPYGHDSRQSDCNAIYSWQELTYRMAQDKTRHALRNAAGMGTMTRITLHYLDKG